MSYVKENFKLLSEICYCIAKQFGSNCEVVLHDLNRPYDNTIVAIYNGHVTGRKVGDGVTNAGLELLRGMKIPEDQTNYINTTQDGKILRSTSKYIYSKDNKNIAGSICINFDITDLVKLQNELSFFTHQDSDKSDKNENFEIFSGNVHLILNEMMKKELEKFGKNVAELTKEEKIIFVNDLDKQGAFLVKKSAGMVADFLALSRFTIYNYINKYKGEQKKNERSIDKKRTGR